MKRNLQKIILASLLLFCSVAASAQWTPIDPISAGLVGNDGAVTFSIGSKGYVVGGSGSNIMYGYDTTTATWSVVDTIPAAMGHAFAMSFEVGGRGFVVGGDTSGIPVMAVWEFDPLRVGYQWTRKNDFPGGPRNAGFGFALSNVAYVGGGNDNISLFNDIWKYNAALDHWTQLATSIPINGLIFPVSFVIGNKGYIATGGINPSGVNEIKNMWCLDGSNDSLSAKRNFAGVGRQAAFAFSNNAYGYIGGGQANYTTNYYDMYRYDPINDQWSSAPTVPLLGSAWASAFVIGNSAYAGIGAKFVSAGLTGNLNFYKFTMSIPTGINDPNNPSLAVEIYPNPASDFLRIALADNKKVTMELYSSTGEKVRSGEIKNGDVIPVSGLAQGIYFLKLISDDKGIAVKKVQVNH